MNLAPIPTAVPTPILAQASIQFLALCEPCGWQGRLRRDNLVALADWDSHVLNADHRANVILGIAKAAELEAEANGPAFR